jgi:hypothetical protein
MSIFTSTTRVRAPATSPCPAASSAAPREADLRASLRCGPTRARGLLFLLALLPSAPACLGTGATPVSIARVTPVGDVASTRFALELRGRGFGLERVTYDLAGGTGTASVAALRARIVAAPRLRLDLPQRALQVSAPDRLVLTVALDAPLSPGIYGLQLFSGATTLASVEAAFEVPSTRPDAGALAPDAGADPDSGAAMGMGLGALALRPAAGRAKRRARRSPPASTPTRRARRRGRGRPPGLFGAGPQRSLDSPGDPLLESAPSEPR